MMERLDYEEMILLRIIELNTLMPHYWSELFVLANQLFDIEESGTLFQMIKEVEDYVLETEYINNVYACSQCKHKWFERDDVFDVKGCPKCKSVKFHITYARQSLYDIEMAIESNKDFNAYFERYGEKIDKFSIERRLNRIKEYIFLRVKDRASKRRFKRFR